MAANPTIIKQNVQDWFEIQKKLGNYELFPEEQTIIEYLKDYWRNFNNVGDDDGQCQSYLEQLKDFKNKHPKKPEVATLCNQLRGLAEKNFLRDNDTYHLFQQAAREYVKQHKPQAPKPQQLKPQQQPSPQQPKPRVNMAIVKVNVQDWCESMQKLAYSNISDDELTLIDWLWNYPLNFANMGEDSGQCRTCIEMIKDFKNKHAKDPEVVTLSNKLRGIAEKMFLTDNATYQACRQQLQQTIQGDSFLGLSPVGLRQNAEASREFEREMEELLESANTPKPQPQPQPKPTTPTKPTGVSRPPTPPQKPTTTTPKPATSTTTTKGDDDGGSWGCGCLVIIIAAVLYFGGWNWIKGWFSSDDDTKTKQVSMFVLVESLNMRAAPSANGSVLATLGYGDHLNMDENSTEDWASVRTNSSNGFVARPFIGTRDEIDALLSVFSTDGTRQAVTDIRHRRALIQFVKESKAVSNYDTDGGYTLHASGSNSGNVWRHKSLGGNGVFAFILDKGNGGRVAAVCSYGQNDEPYFNVVNNNVEPGQYIEKVTYRNNEFKIVFGNKKGKKKQKTGKVEKATEVVPTAPSIEELKSQKNEGQSTGNASPGFHFERVE